MQKLGKIIENLEYVEQTKSEPAAKKNYLRLSQLKERNKDQGLGECEERPERDDEEREIIEEFRKKDEKIENKLDDVLVLLDDIQVLNRNLGKQIDIRNELTKTTTKEAKKTN